MKQWENQEGKRE